MASSKNAGRRRFITRQHTSDTSEVDASTVKTPEEECEQKRLDNISLPRDTPSAFVRVAPSSKSATLDWTFRGSKNGLAVSSSRRLPQQPLVPLNSDLNAQYHLASEKVVQQPLIYTTLETSTGFPPECDSLSLGFRPIRRDSLGSTSSSLAGSTVDSELTISNAPPDQLDSPQRVVKLPPHPSGKDFTESASKLRPWSYYEGGMLMPRTVLSSTGSASSYDNLDKMDSSAQQKNAPQFNSDATQVHPSSSPRFARTKHFDNNSKRTPSPPSIRRHGSPFRSDDDKQFYVTGSRMQGNKGGDATKEGLTMSGEDKGETPHFLEGVCRRRMAGGHVQVIPPHLVGVFDPSRFIPTSVHAPSETNASSFADMEKTNSAPVMKQPESAAFHLMSKLPSKLPTQPSFMRPSESHGKSLLPHVSRQHTSKDVTDHSLSIHANPTLPFASKDSGLSTGENLARTSVPKVNAGRKSYKNEDSLAKDASPRLSDKHLFSTARKGGSNTSNQEQESVTDLFHHVLPGLDSSHYGGPVFQDAARYTAASKESQMPSTKTSAFLATNHSSPSKQGSPKYSPISTQKSIPKWESSSLSKGGKKCEQTSPKTSSPKTRPRHDQTAAAKSSPKWERTSSAKSNLTSSPKSSPKLERTAAGRRNLKWEAPSTTSAKVSQQSSCPKSISKWEPAAASKDNTKFKAPSSASDHLLASFSATSHLEKAEAVDNAHIVEKAQYNRSMSDAGQLRLHNTITDSVRLQEKPTVSGDGSLPRPRTDRDKRKAISTQLQTIGASDSVFSARRKQFSSPLSPAQDKLDHQSRTGADVTVERASRPTATARQNTDEGKETVMSSQGKSETGNSPSQGKSEASNSPSEKATLDARNSNSPRKAADDTICHSDAASDRTTTSSASSSLHGMEKKGDAEQQRLQVSESGESDAHSTRSSTQSAEVVKVSLGEDALQEVTVTDVGVMESESAPAAGDDVGDATVNDDAINSNDVKDYIDLKSAEDATNAKDTGSTDDKEASVCVVNVVDNGNFEVPHLKFDVSECCPQTKTFTDILESIQVVTQPFGTLAVSSSQETRGTTPVFGPSPTYSVHFPLFDVNDEPVIKSSQSSVPDETFPMASDGVSKQAVEYKADQSSGVGEIISSGEKSPDSFPGEVAPGKTEQSADVVNNNLKETVPSTQTICLEQSEISSPVHDRMSLDSISSSSLVELPTKELLVDENPVILTTATEPVYSVTIAQELSYPGRVDKAIFTVDKEISFVSGLLEPDNRGSLPRKVSPHTLYTSLQDVGHIEYLPLKKESSSNTKFLTESTPFTFVTVSSVADPEREKTSPNCTLGPVDKMPGAFQNSPSGNVQAASTVLSTSRLNVTQADPGFTRDKYSVSPIALRSVFDSCPLSEPANLNEPGILLNENDDLVERDKVVSDLDESDDTVDPGGNESKVSTASLDQITQETEIFELAKTSAAYLKPEIASTSSFISSQAPLMKTQESSHPTGKSELLGTLSVPKHTITQNHDSAKHDFVFTSKESLPVNMNKQPEYPSLDNRANHSPFKSEVSPVMAALDDALAVLTSVVMENKNTSGDTLQHSATSSVKLSKKDALKPDIEKVILNLNITDIKKPARSKSTNKEGLSSSKKKTGVSHKEQQHAFGSSPPGAAPTTHHSDPLEVTDTVRQEIQTVENRRHQLTKEDSFNRPDSPMFHETLPLPKDSIIKRNREHCRDSSSSSDSGGSPQSSPRLAPRNMRRSRRGQDASKSGSATTPLEISGYRPFMGTHSSGRTLSRHQSDIVLDMQSLAGSSVPSGQHLHKTRRHNSDSADAGKSPWPKTVSLAQGMDSVVVLPGARDVKRRPDRFGLPSDIQQSLLLYNQQHGGRRGQSWMQAVDASVEGAFTGTVHPKDKTG